MTMTLSFSTKSDFHEIASNDTLCKLSVKQAKFNDDEALVFCFQEIRGIVDLDDDPDENAEK